MSGFLMFQSVEDRDRFLSSDGLRHFQSVLVPSMFLPVVTFSDVTEEMSKSLGSLAGVFGGSLRLSQKFEVCQK